MNNAFGNFKVYDLLEKRIVTDNVAITSYHDIGSVSVIKADQEGLYLHAIGRRDRYVLIPEIPLRDLQSGELLYAGDILSNGKNNWVIKFDLMRGVYCTMIEMTDAYNRVETLLGFGAIRIGTIFSDPELLCGKDIEVFL